MATFRLFVDSVIVEKDGRSITFTTDNMMAICANASYIGNGIVIEYLVDNSVRVSRLRRNLREEEMMVLEGEEWDLLHEHMCTIKPPTVVYDVCQICKELVPGTLHHACFGSTERLHVFLNSPIGKRLLNLMVEKTMLYMETLKIELGTDVYWDYYAIAYSMLDVQDVVEAKQYLNERTNLSFVQDSDLFVYLKWAMKSYIEDRLL